MDNVEDHRARFIRGEMTGTGWERLMSKSKDPVDQLAALRQRFVQDFWQEAIEKGISDNLDRRPFLVNGTFDFRAPPAETEPCRCKGLGLESSFRSPTDRP